MFYEKISQPQESTKRLQANQKKMLLKNIEKIVTYSLIYILVLLPECLVPFTAFSVFSAFSAFGAFSLCEIFS